MKNKRPTFEKADLKIQVHNTTDADKKQLEIGGRAYPVVGQAETGCGVVVSLVDMKQMSDERWIELTNSPEQIARRKEVW